MVSAIILGLFFILLLFFVGEGLGGGAITLFSFKEGLKK